MRAVEHHAALDWRETPAFMADLARREGVSAGARAFTILTAARSGEVRCLTWGELDLKSAMWTEPAGRMKAGKEPLAHLIVRSLPLALPRPRERPPQHPLPDVAARADLAKTFTVN